MLIERKKVDLNNPNQLPNKVQEDGRVQRGTRCGHRGAK